MFDILNQKLNFATFEINDSMLIAGLDNMTYTNEFFFRLRGRLQYYMFISSAVTVDFLA